jgi:hypothetical protein
MQIELTVLQYKNLIQAVSLAQQVNQTLAEHRNDSYINREQVLRKLHTYLCEYADDAVREVDGHKSNTQVLGVQEMEGFWNVLDDYTTCAVREIIGYHNAWRDLYVVYGDEGVAEMSVDEIIQELERLEKVYHNEIDQYEVRRLVIDESAPED